MRPLYRSLIGTMRLLFKLIVIFAATYVVDTFFFAPFRWERVSRAAGAATFAALDTISREAEAHFAKRAATQPTITFFEATKDLEPSPAAMDELREELEARDRNRDD